MFIRKRINPPIYKIRNRLKIISKLVVLDKNEETSTKSFYNTTIESSRRHVNLFAIERTAECRKSSCKKFSGTLEL